MLATEWPSMPASSRARALRRGCGSGGDAAGAEDATTDSSSAAAAVEHLVVTVEPGGAVVGHAQLQRASAMADAGRAALVHSVLVAPAYRRRGLGRLLMRAVEDAATRAGYCMVYLSTPDRADFYRACGYHVADAAPVAASNRAAAKLTAGARESIEGALAANFARMQAARGAAAGGSGSSGAADGGGGAVHVAGNTWMRKRLVDFLPATALGDADIANDISRGVEACVGREIDVDAFVARVPSQRQVGPTCGLTALRMAMDAFGVAAEDGDSSLLARAAAKGFTTDGEMFSAEALADVAASCCGLDASLVDFSTVGAGDVRRALAEAALLVVPYDRGAGTSEPAALGGASAHWCLIVGAVGPRAGTSSEGRVRLRDVAAAGECALMNGAEADGEDLFVVCQHSMSAHLFVTPLGRLRTSNAQLLGVKESSAVAHMVIPEGGPQLAGRVVVVRARKP